MSKGVTRGSGSLRILGGELKGRKVRTVEGPGYRPATAKVREAIFNMLAARGVVFDGLRLADVFAGSGSLGIEALSRGAEHCVFVEQDKRAASAVKAALKELGLAPVRGRVIEKDALAVVRKPPNFGPVGLVFVDPPYGKDLVAPVLRGLMKNGWLADGAMILAELEVREPLPEGPEFESLEQEVNRTYGQTRIVAWSNAKPA